MLLTYYCDIQKQSFRKFAKFGGKQLCRGLFFSKIAGGLKKRLRCRVLSEHFPKNALDIKFFLELVLYRYSRNNWIFFQVIRLFLHVWFLNYEAKLIGPANRTKQRLYWQSIYASVTLRKLEIFYISFSWWFSLFNQGSLKFFVYFYYYLLYL